MKNIAISITILLLTVATSFAQELNQQLFDAVENNDLPKVKRLIKKGADINKRNNKGQTVWHIAIYDNNEKLCNLLLKQKTHINTTDTFGRTPLLYAIFMNNKIIAQKLIEKGANVNLFDRLGYSPLIIAIYRNYYNIEKLLLNQNAIENNIEPKLAVQIGHTKSITSACFSNDSKYILTASEDNTIKLWDIRNKAIIRTFYGHLNKINSVCFSPDNKYILSGSNDGTVKIWDIYNGLEVRTILLESGRNNILAVNTSTDGENILISSSSYFSIFNFNTGELIKKKFIGANKQGSFSPDINYLLLKEYISSEYRIFDIESNCFLLNTKLPTYDVACIYSDDKYLSYFISDRAHKIPLKVEIYNIENLNDNKYICQPLRREQDKDYIYTTAYSSKNSKYLISGGVITHSYDNFNGFFEIYNLDNLNDFKCIYTDKLTKVSELIKRCKSMFYFL